MDLEGRTKMEMSDTQRNNPLNRLTGRAEATQEAVILAEKALGENLMWLTDKFDLEIRQDNQDVVLRLRQLEEAWAALVKVM
jgi:hypothetical protein